MTMAMGINPKQRIPITKMITTKDIMTNTKIIISTSNPLVSIMNIRNSIRILEGDITTSRKSIGTVRYI